MRSNSGLKKILIIYGGILLVIIVSCIAVYMVYNNKVKESARQSLLAAEKITELVPNDMNHIEDVTSEISKTINEVIEESINENNQEVVIDKETENNNVEVSSEQEESSKIVVEEPVKPLEFIYPVEGEIIKEYAIENLIFSETLQEWIVHKGIDIKAPRTTVVKASEEGTVSAIKNDPRYGLTVIIEHRDGYKSIYSNLLTTEFVTEGETVTKGQSLGTVGNSAAFEIADEPHLHFEMLLNDEPVDPTIYLK